MTRETILVRPRGGLLPFRVIVLRRDRRRVRRLAVAMQRAGRPAAWIAEALRLPPAKVAALIGEGGGHG